MADLVAKIEAMTPEQRAGALAVLDELSRPMTAKEIEAHLRHRGVSKSRAVIIAGSVKHMHIIALLGGEHG